MMMHLDHRDVAYVIMATELSDRRAGITSNDVPIAWAPTKEEADAVVRELHREGTMAYCIRLSRAWA